MSDTTTEQKPEATGPKAEPAKLPDDHPLVTAYARQKAENESLKDKARRLDEIEDKQKTDAEKVAEKLAAADAQVKEIPARVAEALRTHVVRMHEISTEDADLFLTAADPETLLKQAERLVGRNKGKSGVVPTQGTANPARAQVSSYELGSERGRARYNKN